MQLIACCWNVQAKIEQEFTLYHYTLSVNLYYKQPITDTRLNNCILLDYSSMKNFSKYSIQSRSRVLKSSVQGVCPLINYWKCLLKKCSCSSSPTYLIHDTVVLCSPSMHVVIWTCTSVVCFVFVYYTESSQSITHMLMCRL